MLIKQNVILTIVVFSFLLKPTLQIPRIIQSQQTSKITGNLTIQSYQPLKLKLSFSSQIPLPKFQLLFNQIPIDYTIESNLTSSQSYQINGFTEGIVDPALFTAQKYSILFTQPLQIANGRLALNSFILNASRQRQQLSYIKSPIKQSKSQFQYQNFKSQFNIVAMIVCFSAYFLAYTTDSGLLFFFFISFYSYLSIQSSFFSSLDLNFTYYMLFEVNQIQQGSLNALLYLLTSHMIIAASFVIGLISRFSLQNLSKKSALWNYTYFYFSYKFFFISYQIMFTPIFANTVELIRSFDKYSLAYSKIGVCVIIYYSIAIMVLYIYLTYFLANPKIGQSQQKYEQYSKTQHFKLFSAINFGVDGKTWINRNYKFIIAIVRVIFIVTVTFPRPNRSNSVLQILFFTFFFSVRPFNKNFFAIYNLAMQISVCILYLYRYLAHAFMQIGQQVITSTQFSRILLANIIFTCIIILGFQVLAIIQLIFKLKHLPNNLRQLNYKLVYGTNSKRAKSVSKIKSEGKIKSKQKLQQKGAIQRKYLDKDQRPIKKSKNKANSLDKKLSRKQRKDSDHSSDGKSKRSLSVQSNEAKKQKWNKKLKQKSSLLQSISLQFDDSSK